MKPLLIKLLVIVFSCSAFSAYAIEYKWTDHQGNRYFDCGGFVVGGEAIIKDIGNGLYRAKGVLVNRQIQATSIYNAAQIACGEREEYEEKPITENTKKE